MYFGTKVSYNVCDNAVLFLLFLSAVVQIDVEAFESSEYFKADNRKWFFYFVSLFWISYTTFWLDREKTVLANVNSHYEYTNTSSYNVVLYYALVGAIIVKFGKSEQKCEDEKVNTSQTPTPSAQLGVVASTEPAMVQIPLANPQQGSGAAKEFNIAACSTVLRLVWRRKRSQLRL